MKNKNKQILIFVLILAIVIFLNFYPKISRISSYNYLLASDPYFHKSISDSILISESFPKYFPFSIEQIPNNFPPLFYILIDLISLITNINTFFIYQFFGAFITSLYIFILYIFANKILKSRNLALLSALFFASIPILISRGILTLYENLALLFILMILYLIIDIKNFKNMLLTIIFLFALLMAYSSFFYILPVIFFYGLYLILKKEVKLNKNSLILLLIAIMVLIVILQSKIKSMFLFYVLKGGIIAGESFNYLSSDRLEYYFGMILFIISILGLLILFKKESEDKEEKNRNYLLIITFIVYFILSFSSLLTIDKNIAQRFFIYLAIPMSVLSSLFVGRLCKINKNIAIIFIFMIVLILIPFTYSFGWETWFSDNDYKAMVWMRDHSNNSLLITHPAMDRFMSSQSHVYTLTDSKIDKSLLVEDIILNLDTDELVKKIEYIKKDYNFQKIYLLYSKDFSKQVKLIFIDPSDLKKGAPNFSPNKIDNTGYFKRVYENEGVIIWVFS